MLFFVGLEFVLRWANVGEAPQPLVIEVPKEKGLATLNPRVAERYFAQKQFATAPQLEFFEKTKSDSTIRIVVQGASSSAGFPYRNASFPKLLEQKLAYAFPNYTVEVINTSIVATNSYTWLDLTAEIIALDPDMVLVYGGHNEYYGALGVASSQSRGSNPSIVNLYLKLKHLRTVQLLSNAIASVSRSATNTSSDEGSLMAKMVKDPEIAFGSDLYENGKEQFRFNIGQLLERYDAAEIPVYISSIVSNVKDFEPFASSEDEDGALANFQTAHEALRINSYQEAKSLFELARDRDLLRFRAAGELNDVIEELALDHGAQFVDMKAAFEAASSHRLIGNGLMHEHVHPKLDGQKLFTDTFYEAILNALQKQFGQAEGFEDGMFSYAIAEADSVYADLLINQMMPNWPFLRASASTLNLSKQESEILSGSYSWYQVLIDSYNKQLAKAPQKAINTAKVFLQDQPRSKEAYRMLLEAYLAATDFENAEQFLSEIPNEFIAEETYGLFIDYAIQDQDYSSALAYLQNLTSNYPNYRLYERQAKYLKAIENLRSTQKVETSKTYFDALEAFIFFNNLTEAERLLNNAPRSFQKESRFNDLARRYDQLR